MLHERWSPEAWPQVKTAFFGVRSGARDGLTNSEELTRVLYIYMLLTLAMA
jgi:hypothetical protein